MNRILASFDTIAAIATPPGRGGIGIIRLSGPDSIAIITKLVGSIPKPRVAAYRQFKDREGEVLDQGLVLYFPKPHSFTGEEVIELQGHGGPAVMNALLQCVLQLGARLARPGEFSERAFLNDRLDLAQAEAIADLIHASSEQAARAAMRSLQGEFSQQVTSLNQSLIELRAYIEASIDFAEEAIEFLTQQAITQRLLPLLESIRHLKQSAQQGQRLQEGMRLVIAGPPNAGKSSLLNALSGQDTAIVTAIAGTTRDVLHTDIHLDGLPLHIIDTAGLHKTDNPVEQEGIRRALVEINQADQLLWVVDSSLSSSSMKPVELLKLFDQTPQVPIACIRNKADLSYESVGIENHPDQDVIRLSATTGEGLDQLKEYLKQRVGYNATHIGFSARERHVVALIAAEKALIKALEEWECDPALEILAAHLTEAHQALGEITGLFTTEDLLGNIFSQFCIGK